MIKLISHKTLSSFYDSLDFDFDGGVCVSVRLKEDVEIDYHGRKIRIDKGFSWNGSSLPGFKHWKINNPFDYLLASLVHDYLYGTQPEWCPRLYADYIYGQLMFLEGAPTWQSCGRMAVLWIAGWAAWRENKTKIKEKL